METIDAILGRVLVFNVSLVSLVSLVFLVFYLWLFFLPFNSNSIVGFFIFCSFIFSLFFRMNKIRLGSALYTAVFIRKFLYDL